MIKKIIMLGLATLFATLPLAESFAYSQASKIYIGADYVYSDIKYKNDTIYEMDDPYSSISPVIGFNSYGIGVEAFYLFSDKQVNKSGYESTLRAYGVELVGEAPLSDNFTVVVSIGMANYKFQIKQPNGWKYDQDANGPRFGIGLQYEILPHIALRTMFHYTSLNAGSTDFYDAVSEISGGVRIMF